MQALSSYLDNSDSFAFYRLLYLIIIKPDNFIVEKHITSHSVRLLALGLLQCLGGRIARTEIEEVFLVLPVILFLARVIVVLETRCLALLTLSRLSTYILHVLHLLIVVHERFGYLFKLTVALLLVLSLALPTSKEVDEASEALRDVKSHPGLAARDVREVQQGEDSLYEWPPVVEHCAEDNEDHQVAEVRSIAEEAALAVSSGWTQVHASHADVSRDAPVAR